MVATKAFFKLLANRELSDSFEQLIQGKLQPKIERQSVEATTKSKSTSPSPPAKPTRSDALSLLAALQRESRLLDIVKEPLDGYSDAQVGSAARDVLKNANTVIDRMFALQPLTDVADGSELETQPDFDPAEFRLTGIVAGSGPFRGTVAHHGWRATRCDVPKWSGNSKAAMIVAPVELEIS